MKQLHPTTGFENEEDRSLARILSILIWASWATYLIVILIGFYLSEWKLITVTLAGCVLQAVPWWLLRRGHLRASSFIFMLNLLGTVTIIATAGQGIRDTAIVAFPIVFVLASLTLNRSFFGLCVGLTLVAIGWLVFGEANSWFVVQPDEAPNWVDFLVLAVILLVSALAVDLLATNMRKNLELAHREITARKQTELALQELAMTDPLTGLYNRRHFINLAETLLELAQRYQHPLSILMLDIDHFKQVNDTHGHAMGDDALRFLATSIRRAVRAVDVTARFGGDEFVILMPETNSAQAAQIAERLRLSVVGTTIAVREPTVHLTLSLGVATLVAGSGIGKIDVLLEQADRTLYAAKQAGRNQVQICN